MKRKRDRRYDVGQMKRDGDREFKSNDMQAIACNSRYLSRGSRKKDKRKTI